MTVVSETMPAGTMSGTPQVLLAHHLKQLKLPTVLREYEKVARECAQGGIDHPLVRRQNIWRNLRCRLAECGPRLGVDVKRRVCGVASADVRWSFA
jgi:predicted metallo-beta-lactamase superfamily hydrolase